MHYVVFIVKFMTILRFNISILRNVFLKISKIIYYAYIGQETIAVERDHITNPLKVRTDKNSSINRILKCCHRVQRKDLYNHTGDYKKRTISIISKWQKEILHA